MDDDIKTMTREQLEAELTLARKLFWLSAGDYIFWSSYNAARGEHDDGAYPAICTNDLFVYGADAEALPLSDVDEYIAVVKRWPAENLIEGAYVAAKKGGSLVKGTPERKADFARLRDEVAAFISESSTNSCKE